MKKILFISATSNTNLKLADNLCNIFKNISSCSTEILNIEKYKLPLFNPSTLEIDKANSLKNIINPEEEMEINWAEERLVLISHKITDLEQEIEKLQKEKAKLEKDIGSSRHSLSQYK